MYFFSETDKFKEVCVLKYPSQNKQNETEFGDIP